jgi:hypothetical protein
MFNRIKGFFKKRSDLKHIGYFGGHNFYVLEKVHNISPLRYEAFIRTVELIRELFIPPEKMSLVVKLIKEANDKKDSARIANLCEALLMQNAENKKIVDWEILEYMHQFILVDNENPKVESLEKDRYIKEKVWNEDPRARFFFSNFAMASGLVLQSLPENMKIEDCLIESRQRMSYLWMMEQSEAK